VRGARVSIYSCDVDDEERESVAARELRFDRFHRGSSRLTYY